MDWLHPILFGGVPWLTDAALCISRWIVGLIFAISGYYKLFDREEHGHMTDTLRECGIPKPAKTNWLVSWSELVFGALMLLGLFTGAAALVLLAIIAVAYVTDGYYRRKEERFFWWLSIECMKHQPLIAALLILLFVFGAGNWSLDAWL